MSGIIVPRDVDEVIPICRSNRQLELVQTGSGIVRSATRGKKNSEEQNRDAHRPGQSTHIIFRQSSFHLARSSTNFSNRPSVINSCSFNSPL